MSDTELDARFEIAQAYLHQFVDARYKHNFADSSEQWLKRIGFYHKTSIIPSPRLERWRKMLGMAPSTVVKRYFDDNGKMIDYDEQQVS